MGLYIQEIRSSGWLGALCQQLQGGDPDFYQDFLVFQRFQPHPYTHRFYVSVDCEANWEDERVKRAEQLIYRATVLSRVIRPTPIALHGAMYLCVSYQSLPTIAFCL